MILTQCAACAKPLAHDAPRCVRCWTRYCDASCQLEHWSKGHKKQCKKIARGGGAEQFHADTCFETAAYMAVLSCSRSIPADAICYICRDDASREGLVTGCGCHGGDGIAHVSCLVRMARLATKDVAGYGSEGIASWQRCSICRGQFHGELMLALAWGCWSTYLGGKEQNVCHPAIAMGALGTALNSVNPEAALPVLEAQLETLMRAFPDSIDIHLHVQGNIAGSYAALKRHEEALALRRLVYAGICAEIEVRLAFCAATPRGSRAEVAEWSRRRRGEAAVTSATPQRRSAGPLHYVVSAQAGTMDSKGPTDESTILNGNNLTDALISNNRFAEAIPLAREMLHVARQALGDRHLQSIYAVQFLARALSRGAKSRADIIEAEALLAGVIPIARHALGPRVPLTLSLVASQTHVRRVKFTMYGLQALVGALLYYCLQLAWRWLTKFWE